MPVPALTQPKAENTEFGAFSRRIIRAYSRRIADGDLDGLADLVALRDAVDDAIDSAVTGLRAEPHAHSWRAIAQRLGVSKPSVVKRWGPRGANVGGARASGGQPYYLR